MIEALLKNKYFRRFFPPLIGIVLIGVFTSLGFWQLDRATQKEELLAQFADGSDYARLDGRLPENEFQRIEVNGRFLSARQVLIENIVRNSRIGYFVITPFQQSANGPLLLVNRGWRVRDDTVLNIDLEENDRTLRGRAGQLPRVGVRAGNGFDGAGDWPKNAVYPTLDEVAFELSAELLPFVLLLGPDEQDGYRREWQPQQSGPMTNYGYAFQWFAMAIAVLVIFIWQIRKGAANRERR